MSSSESVVEIVAIAVNDTSKRLWARPYLVKFGKQFGAESNHLDIRNRTLFDEHGGRTDQWPDQLLDDGLRLWMLTVDGTPAGYIFIRPESGFYQHCMHIRELFIDPKHRRKGYARQLMAHAITEMRRINPEIRRVSLNVMDKNLNAKKLYAADGFVPYTVSMIKEL